ncbi:MAG: hypothetical protein JWR39_735 [Devosia sp.]|nr:hypothetical protein [Devosia sp.]
MPASWCCSLVSGLAGWRGDGQNRAMRCLLVVWLLLLAGPVLAQGMIRYENARLGFVAEVPAAFVAEGTDAAGQSFRLRGQAVALRIWGEPMRGGFSAGVARVQQSLAGEGWRVVEQATTPDWARFSASKGSRMRVVRMIGLCDGASFAAVQVEFSAPEQAGLHPTIDRLGRSLRAVGC